MGTDRKQLLIVTGLSGAGKTTALKTLEDLGWETVDNFPLRLVGGLLSTPPSTSSAGRDPPLAIGIDSRTRGFDPAALIEMIKDLGQDQRLRVATLFLDCAGKELERRYAETRRKHPLALDRPAHEGIALERSLLAPMRRWADFVIDTSELTAKTLEQEIRRQFQTKGAMPMTVTITSFGFSRGLPNNIDLLFDVRHLNNPYWDEALREKTGLDPDVAAFVRGDDGFEETVTRITDLLHFVLPRYESAGKAYVNIGVGCTGGRHRSVHVAQTLCVRLQDAGFSPTISHRNLNSRPVFALEEGAEAGRAQDEATIRDNKNG